MSIYTKEQITRELNKAIPERGDTATRLLRTLLTLAATLLTILLPLSLFGGLSRPSRICLLCGGVSLFCCVVVCIAGLCLQMRRLKQRIRNLSDFLYNFEEYSQLPGKDQFQLLKVGDGGSIEILIVIALTSLCVAMGGLLGSLFQILLS